MPVINDYRWGAGFNVALGSLIQVENQLRQYNVSQLNLMPAPVTVKSPILDEFPIREVALSGKERGDGMVNTSWEMIVAVPVVAFIEDTYFSGGTVVSVPMTIYTRRHIRGSVFVRRNAYMNLPSEANGDYELLKAGVVRVIYRFSNLTVPS